MNWLFPVLLSSLCCLVACYPREMVLADPLSEVVPRSASLCVSGQPFSSDLPPFEPGLLTTLTQALQLTLTMPDNCEQLRQAWHQGATTQTTPVLIETRLHLSESLTPLSAWPSGWGQSSRNELHVRAELSLNIWSALKGVRLQRVEVTESARSQPADKALLYAQLWEKLLQKARLELQPRYQYR
jgi:hypothetical protein